MACHSTVIYKAHTALVAKLVFKDMSLWFLVTMLSQERIAPLLQLQSPAYPPGSSVVLIVFLPRYVIFWLSKKHDRTEEVNIS